MSASLCWVLWVFAFFLIDRVRVSATHHTDANLSCSPAGAQRSTAWLALCPWNPQSSLQLHQCKIYDIYCPPSLLLLVMNVPPPLLILAPQSCNSSFLFFLPFFITLALFSEARSLPAALPTRCTSPPTRNTFLFFLWECESQQKCEEMAARSLRAPCLVPSKGCGQLTAGWGENCRLYFPGDRLWPNRTTCSVSCLSLHFLLTPTGAPAPNFVWMTFGCSCFQSLQVYPQKCVRSS